MDSIKTPPFEDGGLWGHPFNIGEDWRLFRVGTVNGIYRDGNNTYEVLAIQNDEPGNKHVEAAFAYFFTSCKRDKRDFIVRQVWNIGLAAKLSKMGFTCINEDDYIKNYKEM